MKQKVICIVGPTASGKSSLAFELAKELKTEIISADSRLIYQELDIGTDKPDLQRRREIKHHLIDLLKPNQKFNLVDYLNKAEEGLLALFSQQKIPIVVGGTGFYFKALFQDLIITKTSENTDYRSSLQEISTERLFESLNRFLEEDHSLGKRFSHIHENDRFRIIRALEIIASSEKNNLERKIDPSILKVYWIGLNFLERRLLREKIGQRAFSMIFNSDNLIQETENLVAKYGELELLKKTIGYAECLEYLHNKIPNQEELVSKVTNSTCQYAKRQITWFKPHKEITWLDSQAPLENKIKKILEIINP